MDYFTLSRHFVMPWCPKWILCNIPACIESGIIITPKLSILFSSSCTFGSNGMATRLGVLREKGLLIPLMLCDTDSEFPEQ